MPGAAGATPNGTHEAVDAAEPGAAALATATHSAQGVPLAGSRASEALRSAGTPDAQHAHVPARPEPMVGAMQAAQSPQIPGPDNPAVGSHRSGGSADSLSPTAALERMDAADPPRVLESSPQKLTIGVGDAGLGWIEIRTHAVAGQVSATLASGTHEAHAAIAAELPAIRDSLINQHVALHSLGAERFSASSGGGGGSEPNTRDSGSPARQSIVKPKGDTPAVHGEAAGESLSYISVRV
ncbi:MAG TPA: hypothetical protein VHX13_07980 [Acidobacteriaceae bacterium]|nr:hypothetical protein [Acidobacteriaceae bacterium]